MTGVTVADVEGWLDLLYIAVEGAGLRQEDRRKAHEVAAFLDEVAREVARRSRRAPMVLVDAAAGKSYVGLAGGEAGARTLRPARGRRDHRAGRPPRDGEPPGGRTPRLSA